MKSLNQSTSPIIFATLLALFTLASLLSALSSMVFAQSRTIVPSIIILALMLVTGLLVGKKYLLSKITAMCTLFMLGTVALAFGHTVIPDAFLLILAAIIAYFGSQNVLHSDTDRPKTLLYGAAGIIIAVLFFFAFLYGIAIITNIAVHN